MVSRNRQYDDSSDDRYYIKQVSIHLGYSSLEDAQRVAGNMLKMWKSVFVEIYHALHNNDKFLKFTESMGSSLPKGAIIRYANYILENYLFTGRVSYDSIIGKLVKNTVKENSAKLLFIYTVCSAMDISLVNAYMAKYNPDLAKVLNENCSKLPSNPFVAGAESADVFTTIEDALRTYKPINVPRSKLYYIASGISTIKPTISGTQGGVATAPSGAIPIPQASQTPIDLGDKVLRSLGRYVKE